MPAVATASSSATAQAAAAAQPFQCIVCLKRFTRSENLKRHAALHLSSTETFPCQWCSVSFGRADLRTRHYKTKHTERFEATRALAGPSKPKASRKPSRNKSLSNAAPTSIVSNSPPATLGQSPDQLKLPINNPAFPNINGPDGSWDFEMLGESIAKTGISLPDNHIWTSDFNSNPFATDPAGTSLFGSLPSDSGSTKRDWSATSPGDGSLFARSSTSPGKAASIYDDFVPTSVQISKGVGLFFKHVADFLPFLHQPTFDPAQASPYLVLGLLCLGYQYGDDPAADNLEGSGQDLSSRCFAHGRRLVQQCAEEPSDSAQSLEIVQAYLLFQVYSMMYLVGSSDGLDMHSKIVNISRSSGLMQPLPTSSRLMPDLESLWKEFIKAESHKRTMLTLHHMDALWYQLLSVPRLISHPEIKHSMPCHESVWSIATASDWAHRTLVMKPSAPIPIRFSDAIKKVLCAAETGESCPAEFYTVGVLHFLTSSLREVSGYSAMTGQVSQERFKTLSTSLSAAGPSFRSNLQTASASQRLVLEATWEMAMFEMVSWSSAHMSGVVESSLDAALATASCLANSSGFLIEPDSVRSLQVHANWFLLYLDRTLIVDQEPPFVTFYCFRAWLLALQLLRNGTPDAMSIIGIADGDMESALLWAGRVFERRKRWKVGKLILQNLSSLEELAMSF
ncbi:hypothetical protein PROQFM164_S01g003283 [Phaffia rhodozyma]|uniref:C2H2-type domain-containing protein n=1 Tax=Phaffia rhodozyma TaxID=264483 RepID=A0A0F7SL22_PHARH|nr:hypothetical protein PROQFM164_S01g003283 [Phaffia rhodozyma]